jgi:hypothetical protein
VTAIFWPSGLSEAHRKTLADSGIDPGIAAERGYFTTTDGTLLRSLGFARSQIPASGNTIVVPLWGVRGQRAGIILRPDEPRIGKNGKPIKYEFTAGFRMMLDCPQRCRSNLGTPSVPLFVTEGVKKADSAVSRGLCCVAVLGVWNWRGTNEHGGKVALPDWEMIALNGRTTYLVYDSDALTNPQVHKALARLKEFLELRKAQVKIIYLPTDREKKVGLDDYLAAGHSVDELVELASDELTPVHQGRQVDQYLSRDDGTFLEKDSSLLRLANFTAEIVADISRDDGSESIKREFLVSAEVERRSVEPFRVHAVKFSRLDWVSENLGAVAVIEAVPKVSEHLNAAIRKFSIGKTDMRRVYTHTGWREVNGDWAYLHGGGSIDQSGLRTDVTVEIGREYPALSPFVLLPPLEGRRLINALRSELLLLELGPPAVMAPIWSAIWRAAIDRVDFSLHLDGKTGAFKTAVAALAQQHFGAGFHSRALPASWHNSSLANEEIAFVLKDAVVVVDDFKPIGSATDKQRIQAEADKLLRAAGNAAGRAKLNSDSSFRHGRPPRGLILSTGEETPGGESLGARIFVIEVQRGTINAAPLTERQRDASEGIYAGCMSSFLKWLAPKREGVLNEMQNRLPTMRVPADLVGHPRTPGVVADLFFGAEIFFRFAKEVGAVAEVEAKEHLDGIWLALNEIAKSRNLDVREQEPSRRFVALLASAFTAGKAHLTAQNGARPSKAEIWGWHANSPDTRAPEVRMWMQGGDHVGWVEQDDVFLDPAASYRVAQSMSSGGNSIGVEERTLWRRLADDKVLATTGDKVGRKTPLVQKMLEGRRRNVLHLKRSVFESEIDSEVEPMEQRCSA